MPPVPLAQTRGRSAHLSRAGQHLVLFFGHLSCQRRGCIFHFTYFLGTLHSCAHYWFFVPWSVSGGFSVFFFSLLLRRKSSSTPLEAANSTELVICIFPGVKMQTFNRLSLRMFIGFYVWFDIQTTPTKLWVFNELIKQDGFQHMKGLKKVKPDNISRRVISKLLSL